MVDDLGQHTSATSQDENMPVLYACSAVHLEAAKGHFYLIIGGVILLGLMMIIAGVVLVQLGATGTSELNLFGMAMHSQNAGAICIFIGGVCVVIVLLRAMQHIKGILALRSIRTHVRRRSRMAAKRSLSK